MKVTNCINEGIELAAQEELSDRQFQTVWEQIGGSLAPVEQYTRGTLERILERRLVDLLYFQSLDLTDFVSTVLNDMEEEGIRLVAEDEK